MKNFYLIFIVVLGACNTASSSVESGSGAQPPLVETGDVTAALRSTPFSRGVNFSGWFEADSPGAIPFTKYTEQDFADVKSLGADVIRLPVKMHSMTSGAPSYTFDPLFLRFLDRAVDWAEQYELYIIIDNHSFDPVLATSENVDQILLPVWAQIAQRYRDRSDYVIYEILNEPHGISDERWGIIQGMAVDTIRRYDQKHAVIVGGTAYNSINKLAAIPVYTDNNLIYTFHFYDPYLFTHQGANWGDPPHLTSLFNLPFPCDPMRLPPIPADLRGTWIDGSLNHSYARDASTQALSSTLNKAVTFALERDVPVFCGEFGVLMRNSAQNDRVRWYQYVTSALVNRNISWTSWDYYGGFGIFKRVTGSFNHDLNVDVVRALGFTPPLQIEREPQPFTSGFTIFDDYPEPRVAAAGNWGNNMDFSLYDTNSYNGEFAVRWGNPAQYNAFFFNFTDNDFRQISDNGCLEFMARTRGGVRRNARFDVRFVNTETDSEIPWRLRYTIDENILPPDGQWHLVRIPFSEMCEHGAWVSSKDQWVQPRNEFSWERVDRLEFVSEHEDMRGAQMWFDSIKITR
ncbi:MAG: glycoside hydrolase family 5 protein [Treponema sp.]|nr:glycoside hydrolase family 5 protein [Treponema sp.]MCL2180814.1 glycoside hydrolase family 5 protein [Treponema sp.]